MKGWKNTTLPPDLWGPWVEVSTIAITVTQHDQQNFTMTDSSQGRLKRAIIAKGGLALDMEDRLANFPWDVHHFKVCVSNVSHWRKLPES